MKRKIIQISGGVDKAWCLCNDGTVWYVTNSQWERFLEDIPQPEDTTKPKNCNDCFWTDDVCKKPKFCTVEYIDLEKHKTYRHPECHLDKESEDETFRTEMDDIFAEANANTSGISREAYLTALFKEDKR